MVEPTSSSPMLAIIWHSRTGASEAMALAVAKGAGECGLLRRADDVKLDEMKAAAGFVFLCPENLASMSGLMKEMFDSLYYPLLGEIEGRPYASVIAAGSGGAGAQAQLDRIAKGWRLKRVAEEMIVNCDAQTPEAILAKKHVPENVIKKCRDLGAGMAEGMRSGIF